MLEINATIILNNTSIVLKKCWYRLILPMALDRIEELWEGFLITITQKKYKINK